MRFVKFGLATAILAAALVGQARDTATEVPYRVYVPTHADGKGKLPLMVCLHGAGGTENTMMDVGHGLLKNLAEKHGYIVVTPLSEQDALPAAEMVAKEYPVDRSRIYLVGHAEGGVAAWHLAEQHRRMWAGLALVAAGPVENDYPFALLRGLPVMIAQGAADTAGQVERSREQVAAMSKLRMAPRYFEAPAATHESVVTAALPEIFDFFDEDPAK